MYGDSLASFVQNKQERGREISPEHLEALSRFHGRVIHPVKWHACPSLHDAIVHGSIAIGRCWSAGAGISTASIVEVVSHVSIQFFLGLLGWPSTAAAAILLLFSTSLGRVGAVLVSSSRLGLGPGLRDAIGQSLDGGNDLLGVRVADNDLDLVGVIISMEVTYSRHD